MTLPPRSRTSPASPAGTSSPSPSTMRSSKPGRGRPTVVAMVSASSPGDGGRGGAALGEPVAGDDRRRTGSSSSMRRMSSTGMSAAPVTATRRRRQVVAGRGRGGRGSTGRASARPGSTVTRSAADPGEHPVDVEHRLGEHGRAGARRRRGCRPSARTCGSTGSPSGSGRRRARPVMATQSVATVQRAAVGLDDALGHAGRARGEEDVGGVVGPDGGAAALDLGAAAVGGRGRGSRPTTRCRSGGGPRATTTVVEVGQVGPGAPRASPRSRCRGSR